MITRSVYSVVATLSLKLSINASNTAMMKFENFFKQIQKANSPLQTIRIYNQSRLQHEHSDQYLAVTLRILTRGIKKGDNDDPQAARGFFYRNLLKIKGMDLRKLNTQHIKDFIFFYVKFVQHFKLRPNQLQIIEHCLQQFLLRCSMTQDEKQLQLYSGVIFFSIPLSKKYFKTINQQFLQLNYLLLSKNLDKYITDHEYFQKILQNISQFQSYSHQLQKKLVTLVFTAVKNINISQYFTQMKIVALLFSIIKIKKHIFIQKELLSLIDQVLKNVESALLKNFSTLKLYTFSRILPILTQHMKNSSVLTTFFQLIKNSLNSEGNSKIDPRVVVFGIFFIPRQQFAKYFSSDWTKKFIKMVEFYHLRNPYFFDGILEYIYDIINSRKLGWNESFQFFKIVCCNIPQKENQSDRKMAKKLLFSAILQTYFYRINSIQQPLFKLNSHFRERDKKQDYSQNNYSDTIDLYKYYRSICQYQSHQQIMLDGFRKNDCSPLLKQRGKVKFVTDLACLLFQLKIKLAYFNLSHIEVENSLMQPQIQKIRYSYNREKVTKKLLFECKFSQVHFSTVNNYILKLSSHYSYQIFPQQYVTQIIQDNMNQIYQLSAHSMQFLYYFYSKNNSKALIQLMANHSQLVHAFIKYLYPQLVSFIVKNSAFFITDKKKIVVVAKIIEFGSQTLIKNEAAKLFNDLATCLEPLFLQKSQQSFYLYKIFTHYVLQTYIFDQRQVIEKMQGFWYNLNSEDQNVPTLAESYQRFIQSHKPHLQKYLVSQSKISNQHTLDILKQANIQLSSSMFSLKIYLYILQNIAESDRSLFTFFYISLKNFVLSNYQKGQQSSAIKKIIQIFINQHVFCKDFNMQFFYRIANQYSSQITYFSNLAIYPIQKAESLLSSYLEEVTLNPFENMTSFCLIYALTQNPSLQMRYFMSKYVLRYRTNIPFFFKIYIYLMDVQVASKVKLQQANILDIIKIQVLSQGQIQVEECSIKNIYQRDNIVTQNWFSIDTLQARQGIHCQIVRKMLKKIYPQKQLNFVLSKATDNQSTLRKAQ